MVNKVKKDRYVGLAMVLAGLVMLALTTQIKTTGMAVAGDIGSKFFPGLASVCLALCGVGVVTTKSPEAEDKPYLPEGGFKRAVIMLVVLFAYTALMDLLGFVIASPVMLYVVTTLLAGEKKIKPLHKIVFSVVVTGVLYLFFEKMLNILLPSGIF